MLANAYTHLNRLHDAETWFVHSLEAAPDSVPALNNYGRLLRLMRRYTESEAVLRRGVALAPDAADLLFNLGLVADQRQSWSATFHVKLRRRGKRFTWNTGAGTRNVGEYLPIAG